MSNVYLIPYGDRAYHAAVADQPPSQDAIFLIEEGDYPTELRYTRHDLNLVKLWASREITDRKALVEFLDFLGECGHPVEELWEYVDRRWPTAELTELFDLCHSRKMERLMAEIDEIEEMLRSDEREEPRMLFLEYPPCSTCQKARAWLETNNIPFTARHIKNDNPTYEELKFWYEHSSLPLKKFFNTSGLVYKNLGLKDKLPTMTEEEQLQLLATDGMLVKRPLVVTDSKVLTGFREKEWAEALLK